MNENFTPSATITEARFLLPGEVFERKSVRYTVVKAPYTFDGVSNFPHVIVETPDGESVEWILALPSTLQVEIQGRWV